MPWRLFAQAIKNSAVVGLDLGFCERERERRGKSRRFVGGLKVSMDRPRPYPIIIIPTSKSLIRKRLRPKLKIPQILDRSVKNTRSNMARPDPNMTPTRNFRIGSDWL